MKTHDFKKSFANSEEGTNHVIKWIRKLPNLAFFWDVQDNPIFQEQDIDVIIVRKPDIQQTIEIKVDSYYEKSQNIFWEEVSNLEMDNPGCFMYSKATHMFYYFFPGDVLYIFDLPKAREWYIKNKNRFTEKRLLNKCGQYGEFTYTSVGRIINRDIFARENNVTIISGIAER
jgi:hypothetical protein